MVVVRVQVLYPMCKVGKVFYNVERGDRSQSGKCHAQMGSMFTSLPPMNKEKNVGSEIKIVGRGICQKKKYV